MLFPLLALERLMELRRNKLLKQELKINVLYTSERRGNKWEFVGELCRSTGLQSRLEAPLFRD